MPNPMTNREQEALESDRLLEAVLKNVHRCTVECKPCPTLEPWEEPEDVPLPPS